ncbi:superfamily II DNA/RNA helicase [Thermonema lapsum]|uniref:Superfamily II DNA/RNA helicase n=1 Tax=Thermonema lapsum TaxID=28195 RepID=A0A846MRH0_9BACT|nr:helicase-related protein [Thermonema lapsum]NIK73950.1 superfamily II DNA/RNA helicase [Thermonema lapsum]
MSTKFFNNKNDRNLYNKFIGIIENMKDLYAFYAAVGYFRSSGYFALQPYLKNVKEVKILVGINVDQLFAEAQRKGILFFGDEQKTKEEFLNWFIQDIQEARYSEEVENGIVQFVNDIIDGRIEVRAHTSSTLHAKFYLFLPEHHSEHSDGWVIMGSSNLTDAGLGIKKSPNYELNIALKDYDDVQFAKQEFEELWAQSTPILPADIQEFKQKTHIGQKFTPFELYIKFLIEYFGKNIDYDPDTVGDLPKNYKKLSYQIDAVNQGFHMLMEHNGFFLSDVVGLGKTVVATLIAKRFINTNGSLNTKILVVYPPALEKNWKATFRQFGIDRHTKFITNGSLDKIVEKKDLDYWSKEDYDLIIVDEAHRYRNHTSQAFAYLQRICKAPRNGQGLIPGKNKKVILISATPLNNRPQDIYHQLLLFQDARRSTLPVTNLQGFFAPIIKEFKELMNQDQPDIQAIRKIYGKIREKVISQITVRRTRRDLKNYPKYLDDLKAQGITFPEIAPPRPQIYQLDAKLSKLFYKTIFYLTDDEKIQYYRYQAIRYLKPEIGQQHYEKANLVSQSLAGIMKTLMVKRLESSFTAFKTSLQNLATSTQRMIEMFEKGKVFVAPDLNINLLIEKGYSMEELENLILELNLEKPQNNVFSADDFEAEFIEGLRNDYKLLTELLNEWNKVEHDPKLELFLNIFHNELMNKQINPTGKLVIFTESTDTANYLAQKLEERLNVKVLNVSSQNINKLFESIQANFDANYHGDQKNDYNILIATDVLAEGINLHRANVIVNYDTPWNATRLMQRIGRVNRIGSIAGVIYNYNFYPSQQGDEEIQLYKNALVKLQGFHSAFGEDAKIFTHEEMIEQFKLFNEGMPDDEDNRLQYLRFIREFKDNHPKEFKRIQAFPLKARTARSIWQANKPEAKNSSVVFLKSSYKTEFYKITGEGEVTPLTFIEAAQLFEANVNEPPYHPIPKNHFDHIQAALNTFEKEFLSQNTEKAASTDKADANTKQALKFLRDFKSITHDEKVKQVCQNLQPIVEKGTYTPLANELKKISQQFFKKKSLNLAQVDGLLMNLAQKYDALPAEDEKTSQNTTQPQSLNDITPHIILSETFVEP